MTKFNPENKETLTYGEALDPIFIITDAEDARQYKEAYIEFMARGKAATPDTWSDKYTVEEVANENIGYYAGYSNEPEVRERINKLFDCSHPVYGEKY